VITTSAEYARATRRLQDERDYLGWLQEASSRAALRCLYSGLTPRHETVLTHPVLVRERGLDG